MRLSVHTEYALRTLMFLAVRGRQCSITEIANGYGISKNHMMKVAQRLTAEGFAVSVRGRGGGLQLAVPADQLNLGTVVRALEDTSSFVECFDGATNQCVVTPVCGLRHVLAGALEAFAAHLDGYNIADLVADRAGFAALLDARQAQLGASPQAQ